MVSDRFQLTVQQINKVNEFLEGEEGFKDWLAYVNAKVLEDEWRNIQTQYESYFKKYITQGSDVDVYRETKGEFERLLIGIWQCVEQKQSKAAYNLVNAVLGMFWELQFCSLLGRDGIAVYWFQKWEPLGTPRFGWGANIPTGGYSTPDVMFMADDKYWVFAEIKHVATVTGPSGEEGFMLRPTEYRRIQRLRKCSPPIPYWLVINNADRLSKWATVNDGQDWLVWNFDKRDRPAYSYKSHYGRATWVTDEQGMYFFPQKGFALLEDELKELGSAEESQS
jgi:hypothetical protein